MASQNSQPMQFILGQWSVFPAENKLINRDSHEEVRLEPKSMAALKFLIDSPDDVIGIEDFMQAIWQNRVVGDHAVYRVINQLRKNLNPDNKNAYIINIPKQGYKLVEPVRLSDLAPESEHIQINRNKSKIKYWLYGFLALITISLFYWQFSLPKPSKFYTSYEHTLPLTTDVGNEMDPHFSSSGSYLTYTKQTESSKPYHVFILDLSTNQEVQIAESLSSGSNPVLSADANRLVYIRRNPEQCQVILIDKPLAETANESVLFECDWQNLDLEISQDGKTLFYTQSTQPNNQHKIYALSIDTGKAIQLTTIKNANSQGDRIISLSPDNKKLAFLRDSDWKLSELGILNLDNYEETFHITVGSWFNSLGWTPDSEHIIYQDSNRSLSLFSLIDGRNEKITTDFTEDIFAISHNSINSNLAIAFGQKKGGITIKPNPLVEFSENQTMNHLQVQSTEVDTFPSFANHSKHLAFMSKRSGSAQIWLKSDSGEETQITRYLDQRSVRTIRWSPDDTSLLTETQNSISHVNIRDKSHTTLIAENQHGSVGGATWNHDGNGIYFSSEISGDSQIYQLDIPTGKITQITQKSGIMAFPGIQKEELFLLKPHQPGLWVHDLSTGEERVIVKEIDSALHRSIQIKPSGIYFATKEGQIKKYDFNLQKTTNLNIGSNLIVPILTVSDDESLLAFPYYNKTETSIYVLTH